MHLDSKLPNVGLRSRIQQFVGANTPEELELMYHGEIKEDGWLPWCFPENVEAGYNRLQTLEKKNDYVNNALKDIKKYKNARTTRYKQVASKLYDDVLKSRHNPDECMQHIKKYIDDVVKNKPFDLVDATLEFQRKKNKKIREEAELLRMKYVTDYNQIIENTDLDLDTKKKRVKKLYDEYFKNFDTGSDYDEWWSYQPFVSNVRLESARDMEKIKNEKRMKDKKAKEKLRNIKLGAGVTMVGLAALYYNRNFLTKHILKYTFKKDLQKYKKYKRNHTAKKQKPMTFKRWYHKEYPPPKGTQKHNTIINSALEKIDRLKMV